MRVHAIYLSIIGLLLFYGFTRFEKQAEDKAKGKVTGVGGIFFKAKNVKELKKWYGDNLGMQMNEYGSLFEFRRSDPPNRKAYLQWSAFNEKTTYFLPSTKEFMINYQVQNIDGLVKDLRAKGVTILDTMYVGEDGKFIHILDPENNKLELWQPPDSSVFEKMMEGKTNK
jgi:predicted enzyme related to lactoylglutathione lyase